MTHEETALRTKTALSHALKELLEHKPFSKITVSELIKQCNVNRKTFYYHFEDIYGLLKWTLEQEAIAVVKQYDLLIDADDAFLFVIDYVEKNSFFLNCIYDSIGQKEMKRFFYNDFESVIESYIVNSEKRLGINVPKSYKEFLCKFYTEGLAGMLINLFQSHQELERATMIDNFALLKESVPSTLIAAANRHQSS